MVEVDHGTNLNSFGYPLDQNNENVNTINDEVDQIKDKKMAALDEKKKRNLMQRMSLKVRTS